MKPDENNVLIAYKEKEYRQHSIWGRRCLRP